MSLETRSTLSRWVRNAVSLMVLASIGTWGTAARAEDGAKDTSNDAGSSRKTYGWILTGTGVASVGAFAYSYHRVSAVNDDVGYRAYQSGVAGDVCEEADKGQIVEGAPPPATIQDQCSTAQRWQTLQYVFLPLAAVSLSAGIYLLASDDPDDPAKDVALRLETTVQPSGGALQLRGTF